MTEKSEIIKLIEKAKHNIDAAHRSLSSGDYDIAVSRAYYAAFYCAEALLLTKGLRFSKHSAVHAALGRHFVKTGEIDAGFHKVILDLFEERGTADYAALTEISDEDAQKALADAEFFVKEIAKKMVVS
jgi:uncharacterized protein (UPF0332 family)